MMGISSPMIETECDECGDGEMFHDDDVDRVGRKLTKAGWICMGDGRWYCPECAPAQAKPEEEV